MNDQTFVEIIEQTKSIVLSAIGKYLDQKYSHSIDDVVQETYLRAYKSLVKKQFKGKSKTGTWLYTIAKNESLRMNKKLQKEVLKKEKATSNYEKAIQHNKIDEISELNNLKGFVEDLPIKYKNTLSLYMEGYSENEIADVLVLPNGTVKSRIFRGKEMLKKLLRKDYLL